MGSPGDNFNRGFPGDNRGVPVPQKSYELSGKIMLSAIVILFAVVVIMVSLHLYARWYLLRARRRQLLRRRSRRTQLVFYVDPNNAAATPIRGLDASVLGTLPIFVYSAKTHPEEVLECAVCLSEFEENEKGRLLPKCNHKFHTECIDMWFHSHSTCPICRSPVEPQILAPVIENRSDVVISVGEQVESEPGSSSSGICSACQHDDEVASSSSSVGARRKGLDLVRVTIEVPRRNESEDELRTSSQASQGFRSPGSRLLSLKRILSMNRRSSSSSAVSPSSGVGTSCGAHPNEFDIERGRDESTQALTPR